MKRYIITGTPGAGKTSIIKSIELMGFCVIAEAATDIISFEQSVGNNTPWQSQTFIDKIIDLQKQRQLTTCADLQFYDRSPFCTYALAMYLGFKPSDILINEIKRIEQEAIYEKRVLFVENLGFCEASEARKITFEQALEFEKIHIQTYEKFGFSCEFIPKLPLDERVAKVIAFAQNNCRV